MSGRIKLCICTSFWSDQKESLKEHSSVALLSPTCFIALISKDLVRGALIKKNGKIWEQVELSRATLEFSFRLLFWSDQSLNTYILA